MLYIFYYVVYVIYIVEYCFVIVYIVTYSSRNRKTYKGIVYIKDIGVLVVDFCVLLTLSGL